MATDSVTAYLTALEARGRVSTIGPLRRVLEIYAAFLSERGRLPETATPDDLLAFQAHLAGPRLGMAGVTLARSTQLLRLGGIRSFHRWMRRRGLTVADASRTLVLPRLPRRLVHTEHLDQQEAQALIDQVLAEIQTERQGTRAWALALQTAAMVAVALASGRRRSGLCRILTEDLDDQRNELRVAMEKGRTGRVLPLAPWAVALAIAYRDKARPLLLGARSSPYLFVGRRLPHISQSTYASIVRGLVARTVAKNPDLTDLPTKSISTHSLRVTCARLLFANGCPIRSVNEILLHERLSTTARYTPIPVEELRRAIAEGHPRA